MKTLTHLIALGLCSLPATAAADAPRITPEIRSAAEREDPDAMFQLARAHLTGVGAPKNNKKAYELMKAAADKGHPDAIGGLGYFHMKGLAVDKNPTEAIACFRRGAELGSVKSQWNLGVSLLEETPDPAATPEAAAARREEGLKWAKMAADRGLPEAAFGYGRYLDAGDHGLTPDKREAVRYFTIAAEAGHPDACNRLGAMNESGDGCPVDEGAAIRWYRAAAEKGLVRAQSNLGRILSPDHADRARRIEALSWLMLSAQNGDVMAERSLADVQPALKSEDLDAARARMTELQKNLAVKTRR